MPTSSTCSGQAFPALDRHLLPRRPLVFTMHDPLPEAGREHRAWLRLLKRMDAVISHSSAGVESLAAAGIDRSHLHRVPHGAFDHLTHQANEQPLPPELAAVEGPVILFFGLIRPYKGVDVLIEAFRAVEGAELWVVGMPRMDLSEYERLAASCRGSRPLRLSLHHRSRAAGLLSACRRRRAALPANRAVGRSLHRACLRQADRRQRRWRLQRGRRDRGDPPCRARQRDRARRRALRVDRRPGGARGA